MVLVDTSIWINLFSSKPSHKVSIEQLSTFATCLPVIQELIQGLNTSKSSVRIRDSILSLPRLCDSMSIDTYLHAADLYRSGRGRGYTIRSSTDCLIAAIAIECQIPVWHADRDFDIISKYTTLRSMRFLT
jgi:predicted nucleic acid-binding protein